jgi:hypothetical protein
VADQLDYFVLRDRGLFTGHIFLLAGQKATEEGMSYDLEWELRDSRAARSIRSVSVSIYAEIVESR